MGVNSRKPIKPGQPGLSFTSSVRVALTIPSGANTAEIYVRTASIVFKRDGTNPTATEGIQADAGDIIVLSSRDELSGFRGIAVSTTAVGDVDYFTDVSG